MNSCIGKEKWKISIEKVQTLILVVVVICITEYFEFFAPDFSLHYEVPSKPDNANSKQYLEAIVRYTQENLKMLAGAPSVQMQDVPPDFISDDANNMDDKDPDVRETKAEIDARLDFMPTYIFGVIKN